jgi:hypothetical protein
MTSFAHHVFTKKAAALGIGDVLSGPAMAGATNRPAPRGWTPAHTAAPQNVVSQGQIATGLLGSLVGEEAAALFAGFMPLLAPLAKEKLGVDLGKQFTIGTGPSRAITQEAQQVASALQQQQFTQNADKLKDATYQILEKMPSFAANLTKDPKDLAKINGMVNWLKGAVEKANPMATGLVVQQLVQQIPEAKVLVKSIMPDFVFDYTPIVDMTYRQNGGQWSPELFQKNVNLLDQSYQNAAVPAGFTDKQDFLYASQIASERTGHVSPQEALNVWKAGQSFMDARMAGNFEEALGLVQAMAPDAATNPSSVVQQSQWIQAQSRKFGIDPQQFAQAAAMAKERNIPVSTAMAALNYGTRMQKDLSRSGGDQRMGNMLGETYATSDRSKSLKVLQAAVNAGRLTPDKAALIAATASTPGAYQQQIKNLMRDPTVAQTWKSTDPASLLNGMRPEDVKNIAAADAVSTMGATRGGSRLAKMLKDPNRAELLARGVYTGLTPSEINSLNSSSGKRMLAASMAKGQSDATYRLPTTAVGTPDADKPVESFNAVPPRKPVAISTKPADPAKLPPAAKA